MVKGCRQTTFPHWRRHGDVTVCVVEGKGLGGIHGRLCEHSWGGRGEVFIAKEGRHRKGRRGDHLVRLGVDFAEAIRRLCSWGGREGDWRGQYRLNNRGGDFQAHSGGSFLVVFSVCVSLWGV